MELLKGIKLNVEVFAGEDIAIAAESICTLATRTGVMVEADFNGVKVWARPHDDHEKLVEAYHIQLKSDFPYKIAQARDI